MYLLDSVTRPTKQVLNMAMKWLGLGNLGQKRPFMSLFLGAFLITGFLPIMVYLVFASFAICCGVFILALVEGGIITIATLTLMAALILPACIASGLALFAYTVYTALTRMKLLVEAAVNAPQMLYSEEAREQRFDEKPYFNGKLRFRKARKMNSHDMDNYTDSEEDDVTGTKSKPVPRGQHKKGPVIPAYDSDRVRA